MRKLFQTTRAGSVAMSWILVCACFVAVGRWANAAELKAARVTQIIKDVKLLPPQGAPRPAAVSDNVREGTAVRTGVESRAELTFTDLTITRLGANTVFSFNEGTRELDLGSGAILLQVPKNGAAVQINSSAFTAAVTGGTALLEFNRGAPLKFFILEGMGELCPKGNPSGCVTVHPGEMVMATPGGHISQPTQFNVGKLYETSLLITEFSPLPNEALILQAINQQQQAQNGPSNPSTSSNSTIPIDVLSQRAAASPAGFSASTQPPQVGPPVIGSTVPYVINNGTTIVTHPTITTNGVTDPGLIYHGSAVDGPVSAFAFGSTSAFDKASHFDKVVKGNNEAAAFKFESLQLIGNPTIDTTNGPINLGLIAVSGITSGSPGGNITFTGLRGVLLAAQNGSVNLGSEISFSGFHDLNIYARGARSDLTLGSDISTMEHVALFAQRDMSTTANVTTEKLFAVSGRDMQIGGASDTPIQAVTINFNAFHNFTWSGETSSATAVNSSGDVTIFARNVLNITGGLEVDRTNGGIGSGLNVALGAGSNLTTGGGLTINADNSGGSNLDSGANITLNAGGNLTVNGGGALSLTANNDGSHIGTGGNISVTTLGNLSANSINAMINNRNGGSIDSGGNMTFSIGGALTTTGDASFITDNTGGNIGGSANINFNLTGPLTTQGNAFFGIFTDGGSIGGDAGVTIDITGGLTSASSPRSFIVNPSGSIGGNAIINFGVSGDISAHFDAQFVIDNSNAGTINGDAMINVNAANISTGINSGISGVGVLASIGNGGTIGSNASINVTTGDLRTLGALDVAIINGGTIGGNATINMNVSGTANVTNDATVEIFGSDGVAKGAAINFNGGSYNVGGTFLATIDGKGAITLNNANIHAGIVKVGALGSNGTLTIGGGSISANTLLKLYAGSNGSIDFVSSVMLSNLSSAVIIAANKVTISNGVVVTIGGSTDPASVFTNIANYTGFGGNGSTTGTFAGNKATTQPLSQAPSFDTASANTNAQSVSTTNATSLGKAHVGSRGTGRFQSERNLRFGDGTVTPHKPIKVSSAGPSGRNGKRGDLAATSGKTTGAAINVSSSAQLLSLLDAATPDPLGKITIPASKNTANSGKSSRSNTRGRVKADRVAADARRVRDREVIKSTTRSL